MEGYGGVLGLLLVLFIALKLTHVIAWSWWWVLAPLWLGPVAILAIFGLVVLVTFVSGARRR